MRSQPDLDGNRQLDRLTVHQARAGQGAPTGPIYLSRDTNGRGALDARAPRHSCCMAAASAESSCAPAPNRGSVRG